MIDNSKQELNTFSAVFFSFPFDFYLTTTHSRSLDSKDIMNSFLRKYLNEAVEHYLIEITLFAMQNVLKERLMHNSSITLKVNADCK